MPPPLMDIVVLVHDRADWADLCIRAVENLTRNPYRLIIVDMASAEAKTKEVLDGAEKRGHTVLWMPDNRSFSHGVNAGVNLGSAPYICILNDDAIVTDGWDGALIQDASPKHIGLVGARSNFASGAQMMPNFVGEPPFLVFVCVALRREVWEKVGPMDEINFQGFSSEDLDYSWRVKKHGFQLGLSNAYVLHAGSRTLSSTLGDGLGSLAHQRNNEKWNQVLIAKWGKDWIKEHTKLVQNGLVATFHAEEHTRVAFMGSLMGLRCTPTPNTGEVGFKFYHHTRSPIHLARQLVLDYAYDQGFDWLVMLDDDATFPTDLIQRMLARQKEVVCALAYQRKAPYLTCAYETEPGGIMGTPLEGIEHTGLRKVDISGFHCSMLQTSIVKKLRDGTKEVPGTRAYFGGFGEKDKDGKPLNIGEDFAFCLALRKIGVPVYVDTELIAGHIGAAIHVDEGYKAAFKAGRAL